MADATSRPMRVPVTFVPYLEKHRIYNLFQDLLSRVIIKRPDDHLQFLRDELLEIVQSGGLICLQEPKVTEESKGSSLATSSSANSNKSLESLIKRDSTTRRAASVAFSDEYGENGYEKILGSIDYQLNETLASMTEEEFEIFSEDVISTWRSIHRSNKFYDIRELPPYQHAQEERRHLEESDTESSEDNNESNSISLIFHAKESVHGLEKEGSQTHVPGSTSGSDPKLSQSVRSLDIRIKTDKTSSSDTSANNENSDEIATVSYTENDLSTDETENRGQIVQVKLLEGIPSNISNEIKEYVMKLIQEMVEKIILDLPKQSLPRINLNIFRRPTEKKKILHFPRGPVMIPRVVLLGPPGSGKYLQAKLLAEKLNVIYVEMGILLLAWDKVTGKCDMANLMRKSTLRGDELVKNISISILNERLLKDDCLKNGWVLTGYPATASQACALDKIETPPNRIIYLDKPLEQCRESLATRMYDVDTGEVGYIQTEPVKQRSSLSNTVDIMSGLGNIEKIFGLHSVEVDAVSGFIMRMSEINSKGRFSSGFNGKEGLFDNITQCPGQRKRYLRSPADDPKYIDLRFRCHEEFKSQLLKYYGGWCTKLNVSSLSKARIHEAILSKVTGPFPSFEDAVICDRSSDFKHGSLYVFGSQIEAKIQLEMLKFFSSIKQF